MTGLEAAQLLGGLVINSCFVAASVRVAVTIYQLTRGAMDAL